MKFKCRIKSATGVFALGAMLVAAPLAWAGPGDEDVPGLAQDAAADYAQSQLAPYANLSVEDLYPQHLRNGGKATAYEQTLIAQLKTDLAKLKAGQSLGEFYGSAVHPFLERSGAIRADVPLPATPEQFEELVQFILKDNPRNADRTSYDLDYFETMKAQGVGEIVAINDNLRAFYVRDLPFAESDYSSPNLVNLLLSIVVQQSDQDVYGPQARGRYGELTYNRLRYGNVGEGKEREEHVYHGFIFDKAKKMPLAVIGASTNEKRLGVPTIYHHYAFARGDARMARTNLYNPQGLNEIKQNFVSTIAAMQATVNADALKNAYSKAMAPNEVYIMGHTDKYRAAILMTTLIDTRAKVDGNLREKLSREAYAKLWVRPDKEFYHEFNDNGTLPLIFTAVDGSTVPPGDEGTEYPQPNNEYYQELYRIWKDEILVDRGVDMNQINALPNELRNGTITIQDLEEGLTKFKPFARDIYDAMRWVTFTGPRKIYMDYAQSKKLGGPVTGPAIVWDDRQKAYYVADNFPLNERKSAEKYLAQGFLQHYRNAKGYTKEFAAVIGNEDSARALAKELAPVMTEIARRGNSGNQTFYNTDGQSVPTVSGLAIFGMGPMDPATAQVGELIYAAKDTAPDQQILKRRSIYAKPNSKL